MLNLRTPKKISELESEITQLKNKIEDLSSNVLDEKSKKKS